MKKIIHMSDLHVGYEKLGDHFRIIIEKLSSEKGDKASDYVIVITGDLVDNAKNYQNYYEVKNGLDSLKQRGFENILVIPGNHDYGTGNNGDKKFVDIFKKTFFKITSNYPSFNSSDYPKIDIINEVAFIGLDSMAEELDWYDDLFAQGELGEEQLVRLEERLQLPKVTDCQKRVIYLHHHPFDAYPFHELKDSPNLLTVLSRIINKGISIDALLYGHNHLGYVHNGSRLGISRCYDAGTATLKPRPTLISWLPIFKEKASVRVIDFEKDPNGDYVLNLL